MELKLKWHRVTKGSYTSADGRFQIKREPDTKYTWVLTETGKKGGYIYWSLSGCKAEAVRRFYIDKNGWE